MTNMKSLVDLLVKASVIQSERVKNAMLLVDRGDFTDCAYAYEDCAQSINYKATISAPHMHAHALEYLKDHLKEGGRVLDVGSGSGYMYIVFNLQGCSFL